MPRKSTTTAPVFNIDEYRVARHYDEREIEMAGGETLHVTLLHLTTREAKGIPFTTKTKLQDAYEAAAPYITGWDLQAENLKTGASIDVPPPAEAGWEVLEMLDDATGSLVVLWLKNPAAMQLNSKVGKTDSTPSERTDAPSSANGTTAE